MNLKVGALFAGYGGIELALASVLDTELTWYAELDKGPASVMAHHHPDVPNLWDVTKVDWSTVEPVDVITGGSPCQDLSHAGKRKGMRVGTRSGLWASMCDAVDIIRPRLVVWENVQGALSAEADSELEPCPRCVGDPRDRGPVLRALGRVLGDLSELGYDARWYGLRAADVGAAHGRFRIFLFAHPAGHPDVAGLEGWAAGGRAGERAPRADGVGPGGLTLLPTPTSADVKASGAHGYGGNDFCTLTDATVRLPERWGDYAAAIARWEAVTGRPAPDPTEPNAKGGHRLSARFVEWLQGLPEGHVTDVPGMTRNVALKALGNGVVPQQCAAALRAFIEDESGAPSEVARSQRVPLLPTPRATRGGSHTESVALLGGAP